MTVFKHPQEAVEAVNDRLKQIAKLYAECEEISREHDMVFRYEGPAGYGDGGYFDTEDGWQASSTSC